MGRAPHANWNGPAEQIKGPNWVPVMIVGAVIFAVGCGGGIVGGWVMGQAAAYGGFGGLGMYGGPMGGFGPGAYDDYDAGIYLDVERPPNVKVGEPFDLVITVTDTKDKRRLVETVDLNGAICDMFQRDAIAPQPASSNEEYGYHEFIYGTPLAAGESAEFTITLTPLHAGKFDSTVTVYMDEYNSKDYQIQLEVGD